MRRLCLQLTLLALFFSGLGCSADRPLNPSFALTNKEAKRAIKAMNEQPKPLERPVVILGGYHDPGIVTGTIGRYVRKATGDERVVLVAFFGANTFEACRDRMLRALEEKFPSDDPRETIEVDVVASSMGGLVARFASLPWQAPTNAGETETDSATVKQLRIARLFTISTPHRGAHLAALPTLQQTQVDMRIGSDFLRDLNARVDEHDYPIYAYVRLDDGIVGEENAALPGRTVWWVPVGWLQRSHLGSPRDPRIIADILRRLRGEEPFTTEPPAPLPRGSGER